MTFTLIARCEKTGQLGAVTATKFLSSGAFILLARPGVGICASQGFLNPLIRHQILGDLENGTDVKTSLDARVAQDTFAILRQVIVLSKDGSTAFHTGEGCFEETFVSCGLSHIAAGNALSSRNVIEQMSRSFEASLGDLSTRLMDALISAYEAGGDKRGARSAALCVVDEEPYPIVDLRVDDSSAPVSELKRLLEIFKSDYASVTRRLPSHLNPEGILGPVPTKRLKEMSVRLKSRGESIPEKWKRLT